MILSTTCSDKGENPYTCITMGSTRTIASPSLPLELVEEEILCRLPVKTLLQLCSICKSWKSPISDDPKFAKKHLRMSKILKQQQHLIVQSFKTCGMILWDAPLSSVISNPTVTKTKLNIPTWISDYILEVFSCDGILCFTLGGRGRGSALLCNPSLRKYSTLPSLENHQKREVVQSCLFSFGYDHFNDVYKVICISCFKDKNNVVDVYTLGTNYWKSIHDFPYSNPSRHGVFVGGTVNWLADDEVLNSSYCRVIVSLDLEKEFFQKISQPDDLGNSRLTLGMLRDCLCIFTRSNMFLDVWIMKEYGIKESWTKLYMYNVGNQYISLKTVYISDVDLVLFSFEDGSNLKLVVYDSENGNVKIRRSHYFDEYLADAQVYVKSLISLPCSY